MQLATKCTAIFDLPLFTVLLFRTDKSPIIPPVKSTEAAQSNSQSETTKPNSVSNDSKASSELKNNEVVIHVLDPVNGNKRDFVLNQKVSSYKQSNFEYHRF